MIEIFNNIDQIGSEENLMCLSKLVAEICIKEKYLSTIEEQLKVSHDESTFKKIFAKRIWIETGKRLFSHWISRDYSVILFI